MSEIYGGIFCLPEQVEKILKAAEPIAHMELYPHEPSSDIGRANIEVSGRMRGQYSESELMAFYTYLASLDTEADLTRHGEDCTGSERITIKNRKIRQLWASFDELSDLDQIAKIIKPALAEPERATQVAEYLLGRLGSTDTTEIPA